MTLEVKHEWPDGVFALVKFFRSEEHLDALIAGTIYANTPEYYRLHKASGVSDVHESVGFAYRAERNDPVPRLLIDGREIRDVAAATMRFGTRKDAWLHSWIAIAIPPSEAALGELVRDLQRLQGEFGPHYAVVGGGDKVGELVRRVTALTEHNVDLLPVTYSDDVQLQSPTCKRLQYQYQREVRFLIGECSDHHTKPLILEDSNGFADLIRKNADVAMVNRKTGQHMLDLRADGKILCMLD